MQTLRTLINYLVLEEVHVAVGIDYFLSLPDYLVTSFSKYLVSSWSSFVCVKMRILVVFDSPILFGVTLRSHQDLFDALYAHINQPHLFEAGEWQKHWGDGQLFGPSFDLAYHKGGGDEPHLQRALVTLEKNQALVMKAAADLLGHIGNFESVSMALLSLLEAGNYLGDSSAYREASDELIRGLDSVSLLYNDYLELSVGEFASDSYGPTTMTAFLATVHLERVDGYPDEKKRHHLERADEILSRIHEEVWDEKQGLYRFAPGDNRAMLYPNPTMMGVLARAYYLTGKLVYKERFELIYRGIQVLKASDGDYYRSPYSQARMGATDDNYATHSSQNYLM